MIRDICSCENFLLKKETLWNCKSGGYNLQFGFYETFLQKNSTKWTSTCQSYFWIIQTLAKNVTGQFRKKTKRKFMEIYFEIDLIKY